MVVRNLFLAAVLVAAMPLAACKSSSAPTAKKAAAAPAARAKVPAKAPAAPPPKPAATPAAKSSAAAPLPTDPKKLDQARKKAILAGNYKVALKVCDAENMKSLGGQAVLSCVLCACRQGDQAKAASWAGLLKDSLRAEAVKVCSANHVPI